MTDYINFIETMSIIDGFCRFNMKSHNFGYLRL
jgi:hypothetical protein